MTDADQRRHVREVWFVVAVVLILQSVALFGVSALIYRDHTRIDDNVGELAQARRERVGVVLSGCQKGNELRRAVRRITVEQVSRTPAVEGATRPEIDPDAFSTTPCREVVIEQTGVDPGPVANYVP